MVPTDVLMDALDSNVCMYKTNFVCAVNVCCHVLVMSLRTVWMQQPRSGDKK